MSRLAPTRKVELDRTRTLKLDMEAVRWFRQETRELEIGPVDGRGRCRGLSLLRGDVGGEEYPLDEEILPLLLVALCRHEDPGLSVDQVVSGIHGGNLASVLFAVGRLMTEAIDDGQNPDVGEDETEEEGRADGADPPKGETAKT